MLVRRLWRLQQLWAQRVRRGLTIAISERVLINRIVLFAHFKSEVPKAFKPAHQSFALLL